ncbi:MAG: MoaD/ThiS family protein [Myxococcota bacterium]
MAVILIPIIFRGPTQGEGRISVPDGSIRDCFDVVEARFPGLRALVIDPQTGDVHRFVKVSLNGVVLDRASDVLQTETTGSDEIEVIAAIAGG